MLPDLGWMDAGTAYFEARVRGADLERPSRLPGWTGRHVVAHVAANARALGRLAHWARTGEERPMYASAEARDAEIEDLAARLDGATLESLARETSEELRKALGELSGARWDALVRTAQGRLVPASEVVWLRTREVWVHGVDLGGRFEDLPGELVDALIADVTTLWARRGQEPAPVLRPTDRSPVGGRPEVDGLPEVRGTAAELAAWITGRGPAPDPAAPAIGRWL
ncbi:maleylpyruvate isomerase family mycothiol-dependent enzyme [Nonomuraea sp. NPDC005650]|uniref:maleylpyruvate isomerase family mycothiol-dependent enzyme n=1 Tax=Nonomuraea sp. NPDC005650 TaxID=3157045 RepID=UPI0033AAD642